MRLGGTQNGSELCGEQEVYFFFPGIEFHILGRRARSSASPYVNGTHSFVVASVIKMVFG
jgi:hypothetical protein